MLGKVYLYQKKNALAAEQFAQVNGTSSGDGEFTSQYGYELLDDFNDLWVVDNKFNTEAILEVAHTNVGAMQSFLVTQYIDGLLNCVLSLPVRQVGIRIQ